MDTLNIAGYGLGTTEAKSARRYEAATKPQSIFDEDTDSNGAKKSLGMQDFLQLMVAQMRNQDITNPTDNSAFVAQMAQFSTLEAMTTMAQQVEAITAKIDDMAVVGNTQYGASLLGKKVYVSYYDKDNNQINIKGTIGSVLPTSDGGLVTLVEDPKSAYPLYNIMEVVTEFRTDDGVDFAKPKDEEDTSADGAGGTDSGDTDATSAASAGGRPESTVPSGVTVYD